MSDKRFRPPSAYKHGGFSKTVLFPWEDANEFDALHHSLREEWEPSGALEEDAVYTILTCIWRKRRIRDKRNLDTLAALQQKDLKELSETPLPFFDTKLEKNIYALSNRPKSDGSPRYADKVSQLIGFSSSLYGKLDGQFLELSISMLGGEPSKHLRGKCQRRTIPPAQNGSRRSNAKLTRCCCHALVRRWKALIISPGRLHSLLQRIEYSRI